MDFNPITPAQQRLIDRVVGGLAGIGYRGELLQRGYRYVDWFARESTPRSVHAAAFAQSPPSYSTACFAVVPDPGLPAPDTLMPIRALGAPLAFVVSEDRVSQWVVGKDPTTTREVFSCGPDELEGRFRENAEAWSGAQILRLKNINLRPVARQLDFFDLGLIPALEEQVREKLVVVLKRSLGRGRRLYLEHHGAEPDAAELFRLTFSLLAAKVLHDRGVGAFPGLAPDDLGEILEAAQEYYRPGGPVLDFVPTQQAIADELWGGVGFENLTVEVLTYIWANVFVTQEDRREHGIYGTPFELARHVAYGLMGDEFRLGSGLVVEPCCGHGIFLLAAMQRLRELRPPLSPPEEHHAFFARTLVGFDRDPFAVEVAKLCLSLADFPNHNGWRIHQENVFRSNLFREAIRRAKVVLCNPPFRDFTPQERAAYPDQVDPRRPAELLQRVLRDLPAEGLLGFVLPRKFTEGRGYRTIRRQLGERFGELEIVALPDTVYEESEVETVLLLCKSPRAVSAGVRVSFVDISGEDWGRLRLDYALPDPHVEARTADEVERSLEVMTPGRLGEVWEFLLKGYEKLGDVADVRRGVEWEPLAEVAPGSRRGREYKKRYRARYVSPVPQPGFVPGVASSQGMRAFVLPPIEYLSTLPEDQQHPETFLHPWGEPKVAIGAARGSRSPWRLKAAADDSGLLFTQRFIAVWPHEPWTPKILAAVLNGPVACAYMSTRETNRDNLTGTVREIPLPRLDGRDLAKLDMLVELYTMALRDRPRPATVDLSRILLHIDALVLQGYDLPPHLERALLDYFRGHERPVNHKFGDYYPESFKPTIPLWMYVSHDFGKFNARYFLENMPHIDDPYLIEALEELG